VSQPIAVLAVHTVFQPREGRRTGALLRGSQWGALHAQLQQGSAPEALGIMAVRRAGGEWRAPLGPEGAQQVLQGGRRAWIVDGGCEACREAHLVIDAAAAEAPKGQGSGASLAIGTERMTSNRMQRPWFWGRLGPGQPSAALSGIARSPALFYRRLGGSLPLFMKAPGWGVFANYNHNRVAAISHRA
jgi:hypothetical protein